MTKYNWQDLNWQDPNFLSAWGKKLTEIIADFLVIFIYLFFLFFVAMQLLASERNLTHARCEFQPWVNYTAGVYNLSVTIVHDDQADVRTNNSLPVYYYSSQDLSLTSVLPDEVLKDDLPQHVTLNGSGFFDWKETVCYFDSQKTRDVIYINETHLQCRVSLFCHSKVYYYF